MTMLRYLTAGESHGKALTAIVEGLPAGVELRAENINRILRRRQGGYGRGRRMAIEEDRVEFLSGVRGGYTLGSPVALMIANRDWENWQEIMAPGREARIDNKTVTRPRPGHADLSGALKYRQGDMRNILERASARETAIRVALGAVAQEYLKPLGIRIQGQVASIGPVRSREFYTIAGEEIYDNHFYCPDSEALEAMEAAVNEARKKGDSLGGVVRVIVLGLPPGLGSHVHWDRRLDGRLAHAVMSIPAFKGVEIGLGFEAAGLPGSQVHDQICYNPEKGFYRPTNHAGGLEGGMSNGEAIIIKGAMKPIPTLMNPLASVDLETKEPFLASVERSDVCAVPAAAIVAEAVTAWEVAVAVSEKFAGDHLEETMENYRHYMEYIRSR